MASTPNHRTPRPFSAPIMSPLSPGEPSPSPGTCAHPRSDYQNSSTPKEQRCGDRKAEGQGQNQPESTKGQSARPQSTSEVKVSGTTLVSGRSRGGAPAQLLEVGRFWIWVSRTKRQDQVVEV